MKVKFGNKIRSAWDKVKAKFRKKSPEDAEPAAADSVTREAEILPPEENAQITGTAAVAPETEAVPSESDCGITGIECTATKSQITPGIQFGATEDVSIPGDVSRTTEEYVAWQQEQLEKDNADA